MLNPAWLKTFVALAEIGSFTRAADVLGITQAAVSQHVRQLEERAGLLFIRRVRSLELTPAGHAMRDYCRELEALDRRLHTRLSGSEMETGEVSFITPGSTGLFLYPLLLELQQAQRGLVIRHRFAPDAEVLDAVLTNRYELGLVSMKPDDPRLAARTFLEEPLELVVPAGKTISDWHDLVRLGFIDHPDGQAMAGRLLNRHFPGCPGVRSLPISGFSNQISLILEPVSKGLGFTVLPHYARLAFGRPDAIRVENQRDPVRDTLWLIHRAEWALTNRAKRVIEYLQLRLR